MVRKPAGELTALETHTDSLHQLTVSFLNLDSSDLDPSMMFDPGEIVDTGSDYDDQVSEPQRIFLFKCV